MKRVKKLSDRSDQVPMKNLKILVLTCCVFSVSNALSEPGSCFIDENNQIHAESGALFFVKVRSGGKLPDLLRSTFGGDTISNNLVTKVKMMNQSYHYQVNKEVPLKLPKEFALALFARDRAYILPSCEVVPSDIDLGSYAEE